MIFENGTTHTKTHPTIMPPPQYYHGSVTYQKDDKFIPVPTRNFDDYEVIGRSEDLTYFLHPCDSFGFVVDNEELAAGNLTVVPVMKLKLTAVTIGGTKLKQVSQLRIRESYSRIGVARDWYANYVRQFTGIVSDCEHLEGGKLLWQSLIKLADESADFSVSMHLLPSGEKIAAITRTTPESDIWSNDGLNKNQVLVFQTA